MLVTKRIDLPLLETELTTAAVPFNFLGLSDPVPSPTTPAELFTYDAGGTPMELPPEAGPVVDAHVAPPLVIEFVGEQRVSAVLRTTDGDEHDVFVFPAAVRSIYRAHLVMTAIDAGNGAMKTMEGVMAFKRVNQNVLVPPNNIDLISNIEDTAAASWVMNAVPDGTNIRVFVRGAAGRTIDWALGGAIGRFAPEGLAGGSG